MLQKTAAIFVIVVQKDWVERLDILPTVGRRQVSRAARLLIERIATVGNGTGAAAQRRDWAAELEAAASRRSRAQEVSRRLGRKIGVGMGLP